MSAAPPRDARLVGALFVLAAVTFFAGLDSTSKAISAVPVVMAMWMRYAAQAGVTAATLLPRQGLRALHTRHPFLQSLRGTLLLSTSICTYLSLRVMPVGELTAIVMLTPLLLMLVAAFVFGEAVSPLRWALIALSFAGAMLVVRPGGQALSGSLLLPLGALGFNTAFHLVTSRLAKLEDVSTMQLYTGLTGTALATLALPFFWTPLADWHQWALLGLVCVFSTAGHWLLVIGYAKAGIAMLTPLLFAQIAVGTLFGWIFFAHVPDAWALAGICLIATGGAACTWLSTRERAQERARVRDLASLENASMEH